jgi:hypothetical protein
MCRVAVCSQVENITPTTRAIVYGLHNRCARVCVSQTWRNRLQKAFCVGCVIVPSPRRLATPITHSVTRVAPTLAHRPSSANAAVGTANPAVGTDRAVQGMLDFDYMCKRARPSVAAMVFPFSGNHYVKFYWGLSETLVPVYTTMEEAVRRHKDASVLVNFSSFRSVYDTTMDALQHSVQVCGSPYLSDSTYTRVYSGLSVVAQGRRRACQLQLIDGRAPTLRADTHHTFLVCKSHTC